jgi:hypothetical protein
MANYASLIRIRDRANVRRHYGGISCVTGNRPWIRNTAARRTLSDDVELWLSWRNI